MKIILVCSAGMSTSMLVQKMEKSAESKGLSAEIEAVPESQLSNHLDGTNVILIGPQVRYLAPKIKANAEPLGIKVDIINQMDYGMMNGEKVLEHALELAK
ncbi:PTS sugar transporter subunit IIB [Lederbergia lenta]|uniref:PTS system cellobiose-specific transporter subunit IIB n=1 Tax=Lederbergia lenta TaxID=1467 RepID=A0A2X4X032_LEDLE|nr:PTS sugar transporter subunit IIB [Lederbergia lenta]MCM3112203.1 PTS sugar transporter subunit IIB [Lederbergia lenta]MEC2323370.1 PTS sugar transporter subunit IIB [Lederbergia lenta]SQI63300.1 PTS system cellobiose-specific transporter subunit IIB [Lederbergia lenta]